MPPWSASATQCTFRLLPDLDLHCCHARLQAGMAVAMATVGGMGVIHYNNSLEEQLHQVGLLWVWHVSLLACLLLGPQKPTCACTPSGAAAAMQSAARAAAELL